MSLLSLLVHDVTLLEPASTTDAYGDTVKDWGGATEHETVGRMVQRSATEALGDREADVTDWTLYLAGDETISHQARVRWRGLLFEVTGAAQPAIRRDPTVHHLEVPLRRVEEGDSWRAS